MSQDPKIIAIIRDGSSYVDVPSLIDNIFYVLIIILHRSLYYIPFSFITVSLFLLKIQVSSYRYEYMLAYFAQIFLTLIIFYSYMI
jgi:hypothetical protein